MRSTTAKCWPRRSLDVAAADREDAYPLEPMSRADEQLYRARITRTAVGAPRRDAMRAR
jgi:hypothetical protein